MPGIGDIPGMGDIRGTGDGDEPPPGDGVGAPLGLIVIPGIGAILGDGEGDGVEALVLTGAGVLIGMPGMGAIAGSAASTGAVHITSSEAAREKRERSNKDLVGMDGILRGVVHITRN